MIPASANAIAQGRVVIHVMCVSAPYTDIKQVYVNTIESDRL
jgi:hypothetical protein